MVVPPALLPHERVICRFVMEESDVSVPEVSAAPTSAKRPRLQEASTAGPSGTALHTSQTSSYPRMREGNRLVFTTNCSFPSALIVSYNRTNDGPNPAEGEIKLAYEGHVDVYDTMDVTVDLNSATLLVQGTSIGVCCNVPDNNTLVRASQLLKHLLKMFKL